MIASSAFLESPGRRSKLCGSRYDGRYSVLIFHLLDEPVPTLADPFPGDDPLPGAYELHLTAESLTIWYTVTVHEGRDVGSIQHVSLDT